MNIGTRRAFTRLVATIVLCVLSVSPRADGDPVFDQRQQEMERLQWMVGLWEGSGWIDMFDDGRREFSYTQNVSSEFGGLVLLIDGTGVADDDQSIVPRVIRSISKYGGLEHYAWAEFSPEGTLRSNEAIGAEGQVHVGLGPTQHECDWANLGPACRTNNRIRRTITHTPDGEWVETAEFQNVPDHPEWFKFYEVVLRRTGQ